MGLTMGREDSDFHGRQRIYYDARLIDAIAVRYFAGETGLRDALVEAGMAMAGHMAQKVARKTTRVHREHADLVQDGIVGYIHAMGLYDASRTASFSTYAYWWVRQAAMRGLSNHGRRVRVPVHAAEHAVVRRRFAASFVAGHGREPYDSEVMAATGLTEAQLRLADAADGLDEAVRQSAAYAVTGVSSPEQDPSHVAAHHESMERVADWLRYLQPRDAFVLTRRLDLDDAGDPCTLEELAVRMGLTRERVRQLEARGLAQVVKVAGWPEDGIANKVATAHLRYRRQRSRLPRAAG